MTKQKEALEHELSICIDIEDGQRDDIYYAFEEFKKEATLPNAFSLRKMISAWADTKQRYDLLHRIAMKDWGQDDTKHE